MTDQDYPHRRRLFLVVSVGVFMSTMDSSMVNVALPTLMEDFQSSLALTEGVVLVYLLTITILLLLWGHLSDRRGRGRVYSWGMLIFTGGSLSCGLAPEIYSLILFRFIQALGASMMMATGPALIKSIFPADRLGRGLGLIGVATSLGLMAGPPISGLLIRWVNWRAIFWVTVPIGLLFFVLGRGPLTGSSRPPAIVRSPEPSRRHGFDWRGAMLWAAAVTLTILVATNVSAPVAGRELAWSAILGAGLVLIFLVWFVFLGHEKRCSAPLLPLPLFRQRFFSMALVSGMLSFVVLFFVLILTPFYLDRILGLPPDQIGYVMMAVPLCVFIVSPVAGRMHDGMGARIVATGGLLCCLISMVLLTGITAETSPFAVAARLALLGFGEAMFLSPNSAAALAGVPDDQVGVTASLLATARNLGMLLGTALAGLIFALYFSHATGGLDMKDFTPASTAAFMFALHRSFQYGAVFALAGLLASWLRPGKPSGAPHLPAVVPDHIEGL